MKVTADYLRQLIKEETQGEMEFAELEAARQAYLQEPNDETKHQLGLMVEKLVEPIMAELGLFFEAEAYYNVGEIVFSNHKDMEVIIDPRGSRGGYDLKISPLPGAEDDFEVIEDTFGSMKGVTQFIYDLENPLADDMVGEPEAQTELPLEHKMRITKSQLQKVIKEAIKEEMGGGMPSKAEIEEVLDDVLQDIRKHATSNDIAKQGARAEVLLSMLLGGRYATEMYKDMFGERGLKGYMEDRYGD